MKIKFCKENEDIFNQTVKSARKKVVEDKYNLMYHLNYSMVSDYSVKQHIIGDEEGKEFCETDNFTYYFYENVVKHKIIEKQQKEYPILTNTDWEGTEVRIEISHYATKEFNTKLLATATFTFDSKGNLYFDTEMMSIWFFYMAIYPDENKEIPYEIKINFYFSMNAKYKVKSKEWHYNNNLIHRFLKIIDRDESEIENKIYEIRGIGYNPITTDENGAKLFKREFGL